MATLTEQQIALLAWNAGFRGSNVAIATAIAEAESRGVTTAYNPETGAGTAPGMGSYGLWQIYRTAHPQYSPSYLDTPADNAAAAFAVSQGGANWQPWTTYTGWTSQGYITPPYLQFLNSARSAVMADFGTANPGSGSAPLPKPDGSGPGSGAGGGISNAPPPTPQATVTANYTNPFGYACGLITEQQSIVYGPFALDSWNIGPATIPYGDVLNVVNAGFQRGLGAAFGLVIVVIALIMLMNVVMSNVGSPEYPTALLSNTQQALSDINSLSNMAGEQADTTFENMQTSPFGQRIQNSRLSQYVAGFAGDVSTFLTGLFA